MGPNCTYFLVYTWATLSGDGLQWASGRNRTHGVIFDYLEIIISLLHFLPSGIGKTQLFQMARRAQLSRPPPISVSTILYLHSSHIKPLAAFQSTILLCSVSPLFAITHYPPSIWNLHPLLLCLITSPQRCAFLWSRSRIPTWSCHLSLSCFHRILLYNLFIASSLTSCDEFLVHLWSS